MRLKAEDISEIITYLSQSSHGRLLSYALTKDPSDQLSHAPRISSPSEMSFRESFMPCNWICRWLRVISSSWLVMKGTSTIGITQPDCGNREKRMRSGVGRIWSPGTPDGEAEISFHSVSVQNVKRPHIKDVKMHFISSIFFEFLFMYISNANYSRRPI